MRAQYYFCVLIWESNNNERGGNMGKVMINIPLTKYLSELTREFGGIKKCYITKTKGGQVWLSSDAPGDISEEDSGEFKNEIDFSDSDFYMKLPRYVYINFNIKNGEIKSLEEIVKDIKKLEKENESNE